MTTTASYHYMFMLILNILPGLALVWWRARQSTCTLAEYIRFLPNRNNVARLSVYGLVCFAAAILGRSAVSALLSSPGAGQHIQPVTTQIMQAIAQVLPLTTIIFGMLIAALEEIIFRGWMIAEIQGFCARNKQMTQLSNPNAANLFAIAATAILFAIMHGSLSFFPSFLVVGIVFGWARIYSNSLVPSMMAHVLMNFIAGLAAIGWI